LIIALSLALSACGTSSTSQNATPAPSVISFSPASGVAGTTVTITGTNLTGATTVTIGAKAASSFSVANAATITAVVASGSTSGKITVTTSGGTANSAASFTMASAPAISSFSPTTGLTGSSVVITGTNFTGATTVTFNGKAASSFTVNSDTQITATVANGTTTGAVAVTTPAGTATSTMMFSVTAPVPTISSFNPGSGPIGASVVIAGSNFTGATAVALNGQAASSFVVNSATQITAVIASGTTSGKITVTTPAGTATSATSFSVTAAAPTISSFNPSSGQVGISVVIAGSNFTGATAVALNGKAASSFVVNSATQITAVIASGTTSGKITVTTPAGTATSASSFTVTSSNATLDLTIDGLYITQATQEYPNPQVPLVANRSAWVRVFALANQANTVTPQVKVDFINGSTTNTLTIAAGSTSVPLSIDPENAAASWNAAVPASWIQPGTQVVATVDPTNSIPESNKTNNTFTQNLDVRTLSTWKITLLPVHTADGNQGVVENGTRSSTDWLDFAKRLHPVPDAIDIAVGSVFNTSVTSLQSSGTGWSDVLSALDAKRSADGVTDRNYYGAVHTTYNSGVAGIGYIGWPTAIGWDVTGSFPTVLAHEEGHNFNRMHSPCGGAANPDPNYPYPGAVIGVPGWDAYASSNNLKPSSTYVDVMAYCSPDWISDYVYLSELNYRQSSSDIINSASNSNADVVPGQGLLVWGKIENGEVSLQPAFQVPVKNRRPASGSYTWEGHDAAGRVIASMNFDAHEVADLPDTSSLQLFSFVVPMQTDVLAAVQSMHIKLAGREMAQKTQTATLSEADLQNTVRVEDLPANGARVVWDATRYPMVMVRDAQTGEVRGFLEGGNAEIADAPKQIEVHVSGGIQSSIFRHQRAGD